MTSALPNSGADCGRAVRVLTVDDDQELVRLGLRMVINSQADLKVIGEAADGAQRSPQSKREYAASCSRTRLRCNCWQRFAL